MNPPEQDNQSQPKDKVPSAAPATPLASGAGTNSGGSPRDNNPSGKGAPEPAPLSATQAEGVGEKSSAPDAVPAGEKKVEAALGHSASAQSSAQDPGGKDSAPDSPPRQDTERGSDPRKILQEIEKENNSEKKEEPGFLPAKPAIPSSPDDGPSVFPEPSLTDDATVDDLITEAMRELNVLIKKIKESA
ncbi:MAG: hypothetical protein WC450_08320 [Candidatus Omnitrophota bacterium]